MLLRAASVVVVAAMLTALSGQAPPPSQAPAPEVQQYLARMLAAGLTHVVIESTSHGLDQHRVTGCEFDIGVITNITTRKKDEAEIRQLAESQPAIAKFLVGKNITRVIYVPMRTMNFVVGA